MENIENVIVQDNFNNVFVIPADQVDNWNSWLEVNSDTPEDIPPYADVVLGEITNVKFTDYTKVNQD